MNIDRLTQKSIAAIQGAQGLAQEYGNQQMEQLHLLAALCGDDEGLIPQLLTAMGVDAQRFLAKVIPDPEKVIPGGIPSISEFSANENGFKIGVKC